MTAVHTFERYESAGCIDAEDALDMGRHVMAIATALSRSGGRLSVATADRETGLHFARLVRIVQRATQPNVVARATCHGVASVAMVSDCGRRSVVVRSERADMVFDLETRAVRLEEREAAPDFGRPRQQRAA